MIPSHYLLGLLVCLAILSNMDVRTSIFAAFGVVVILLIQYQKPIVVKSTPEKNIMKEVITPLHITYRVPQSYKYSSRVQNYVDVMKKLDFVYKYDVEKLDQIKVMCEKFFKIHFNVILGKYVPSLYISHLYDIKNSVNLIMDELVFVLPKMSTIVDISDIDEFIKSKKLELNAILTKYIKIVHKLNKEIGRFSTPPFEFQHAL